MATKCNDCGRFIPALEMIGSDGTARFYFEPLSEFGPEVSYWCCGDCARILPPASGMSAGTAETQSGSGLQPASPVGEAETPESQQP